MATAYAAVVSLNHVMDQIQLYHARQPVFVDEQLLQLQSLNQLLTFLQDFLECYSHGRSSKEMEALESRIAHAAHAAEDIIESHIVDNIHDRSNGCERRRRSQRKRRSQRFSQALLEVIQGMNLIMKEAIATKEKCTSKNQLPPDPASSTPPSRKDSDVVYEEDLNHILDKLVDQRSSRQVIPITGMGGIGKTTLAKIAYDDLLVVSRFDIRGWVTISQQYDIQEILSCLLKGMNVNHIGQSKQKSLHQHLFGRRYLIVLDDMWSIEAWNELKSSFPDNNCGSRIVVTTRILNVANNVAPSNFYQMNFLDESKSWSLLCKKVFGKENCPPDLVDVGKKIAKNCKGLPLSIGAVGGLLAKSNMVREYWEYVAENTNTTLNSNNEENCLHILSLSYTHLPIHLKPCFLYLGVFKEDQEIRVSKLIKLWVAEGILRLDRAKSLEEVGRDYLKDLIERNLLTVTKLGCTGNMKYCKLHDLLRDMCLVEARKEHFLHIEAMYMSNNSQDKNMHFDIVRSGFRDILKLNITDILEGTNNRRRLAIHYKSNERYTPRDLFDIQPTSFLRSLICGVRPSLDSEVLVDFRLLRVLDVIIDRSEVFFQMINARYIECVSYCPVLPSSICMLWNLQTIIFSNSGRGVVAPVEIWKMPQLKHIIARYLCLPEPPPVSQVDGQGDVIVLENLETLSGVLNFRCTEEVVRKIPNVVKLKLKYNLECNRDLPHYSLNNVGRLQKLQLLNCEFPSCEHNYMRDILGFPASLRKLMLYGVRFSWVDITTKIGPLPYLEKLKLLNFDSEEDEWNPVEGHFLHLKYLQIYYNTTRLTLLSWTGDSVHFPVLEHLVVSYVTDLKEIPSGIGDIATLQLIELRGCGDSANHSAKEILKEQRSYGNESLQVRVNDKPMIIDSRDEHAE